VAIAVAIPGIVVAKTTARVQCGQDPRVAQHFVTSELAAGGASRRTDPMRGVVESVVSRDNLLSMLRSQAGRAGRHPWLAAAQGRLQELLFGPDLARRHGASAAGHA
jgi:hypothetical protein